MIQTQICYRIPETNKIILGAELTNEIMIWLYFLVHEIPRVFSNTTMSSFAVVLGTDMTYTWKSVANSKVSLLSH